MSSVFYTSSCLVDIFAMQLPSVSPARARLCKRFAALGLAALLAGCWTPAPAPGGASFSFAVFGDGPYHPIENGRARRVFAALRARPAAFVIHIGDIMWQRCTDDAYRARRALIETIGHPVVYTPGDNEWSDCVDLARV